MGKLEEIKLTATDIKVLLEKRKTRLLEKMASDMEMEIEDELLTFFKKNAEKLNKQIDTMFKRELKKALPRLISMAIKDSKVYLDSKDGR